MVNSNFEWNDQIEKMNNTIETSFYLVSYLIFWSVLICLG